MSKETTVQKKEPSAIDTVRSALEKMKPQLAMALPKHITQDRLVRVALTCIQNTPKLLECDKTSLYSAIMTCAQLGLEPDGVLGHAYLIPYGNKVQFIPGYKGLLALARNSGDVVSISAHEVREHDRFEYEYGLNEVLTHKPAHDERGEITCFYAYAKFKDGGHHFDVMSLQEVEEIRDKSQGYQAAKRFKKESPWDTHFVEMGRKTLIRRIAKYLPLNVQRAAAIEDYADMGKNVNMTQDGITIDGDFEEQKPVGKLQSIVNNEEEFNPDTGEITNDEPLLPLTLIAADAQRTGEELKKAASVVLRHMQDTPAPFRQAILDDYEPGLLKALGDKGLGRSHGDKIRKLLEV